MYSMRSKSSADYALEPLEARVLLSADPIMAGWGCDLLVEVEQAEVAQAWELVAASDAGDVWEDGSSLLDDATLAGAELLADGVGESLEESDPTMGGGD
jgi:hypothetical protein